MLYISVRSTEHLLFDLYDESRFLEVGDTLRDCVFLDSEMLLPKMVELLLPFIVKSGRLVEDFTLLCFELCFLFVFS